MKQRKLYLDCTSGISGDMFVASLIDLGADLDVLEKALDSLPLEGFRAEVSGVKKSGIACCDFNVILSGARTHHDHDMNYLYSHRQGSCDESCTCGCQEGKECHCHDNCCDENCTCGCHEGKECHCHDNCCDENCTCGCQEGKECHCHDKCCDENCTCGCHEGKECHCHDNCCDENCTCGCQEGKECHCHDKCCDENCTCGCQEGKECHCHDKCCDENCTCGCQEGKECHCHDKCCDENCTCGCHEGKECHCHDKCCDENCDCGCHEGKECHCHDKCCDENCTCGCQEGKECHCHDKCCDENCTCGCQEGKECHCHDKCCDENCTCGCQEGKECHCHERGHVHHVHHVHRNLEQIDTIIDGADMTDTAKALAHRMFRIIGEAEAVAHDIPLEDVHFHEVGAVDSIVDIISAAVCFDNLGIEEVLVPQLCEGTGMIRSQHGVLPVPVPATVNILTAYGLPLTLTSEYGELVTPTGAAIVAALATSHKLPENFTIEAVGLGAGKRKTERAGILRAMIIEEKHGDEDEVLLLETDIDDATGEMLGHTMKALLKAGARDVHYTPIYMKKNRPAWTLTVLCDIKDGDMMKDILFSETTTIGIRERIVKRTILSRDVIKVKTPYGKAKVKKVSGRGFVRYYPEYDSVKKMAKKHEMSFKDAFRAVLAEVEK